MIKDNKIKKDQSNIKKRNRGVRASRIKLQKAMIAAGFKTQISLAERIAEIEKLESVPKELVNKVFRELSVAPTSIERVAAALKVEAYSLYLTSKETQYSENKPTIIPSSAPLQVLPQKLSYKSLFYLLSIFLFLVSYLWINSIYQTSTTVKDVKTVKTNTAILLPEKLGKFSIALQSNNDNSAIIQSLKPILAKSFNLTSNITKTVANLQHAQALQTQQQYKVDMVLTIEQQNFGRFILLNAYLFSQNISTNIWSVHTTKKQLSNDHLLLWQDLSKLVISFTEPNQHYNSSFHTPIDKRALHYYLEGRDLLDHSQSQLNIKSAQSRFNNAVKIVPNFPLAYAGLCKAYLYESWTGDEAQLIRDAQSACQKALSLDADNNYPFVTNANSFLLRRSGRSKEAIEVLKDQLVKHPDHVDTLYNLANAKFELFRENTEKPQLLKEARIYAQKAIQLTPDYWKPYYKLGIIEWSIGNLQDALSATTKAVEHDENELVVTNLGTLSFCLGQIEQAKKYFQRAIYLQPNSHLGSEMMGMVHYYAGEFNQSLNYRYKAIDMAGEAGIHQLWGELADTHTMLNNQVLALSAYQRALDIIERDTALGNVSHTAKVHKMYYQAKLATLAPDKFAFNDQHHALLNLFNTEIEANNLDSSALTRLGLVHLYLNNLEKSNLYLQLAINRCIVYKQHPELVEQSQINL